MFDKHFVGLDLTGVEDNGIQRPVSRVTLLLDDENIVTAGDDTGAELTADCPHATQAVVDAILAQVKGYQYHMFNATAAALDPAAELGDGGTVGSIYSTIARLSDDGSGYVDISAPGKDELEDDFPSSGPMTQAFSRKIAQTRTEIKKTAEAIILRVEGTEGSIEAALDLINGFTVTDSNGTTRIKGSSIDTGSLAANSITADKLNLTGAITFSDLDDAAQKSINAAASNASTALTNANAAKTIVSGWTYTGTTMIDGKKIVAETIIAGSLKGGEVQLLNSDGEEVGTLGIVREYIQDGLYRGAITIKADATGLEAENGRIRLINRSNTPYNELSIDSDGIFSHGDFMPWLSFQYILGSSRFPWKDIYSANDPVVTSDREKKTGITYDLAAYDTLFDALQPASYQLVNGQSGRTHLGLIAQDVEQTLMDCGLTDMDFAGFIKSPRKDDDGNILDDEYDYALRYGEFIAMLIDQVQKIKVKVAELGRRIAS